VTLSAETDLKSSIGAVQVPGIGHSVAEIGRVASVAVDGKKASIEIDLGFPASGLHPDLVRAVTKAAGESADIDDVAVTVGTKITAHGVQRAVNLALALAGEGASVGILDADIYGPSIPLMLGVAGERPTSDDGQSMNPLEAHGIQVMSIGFLVDADQPMVWRGPMVTQALQQMLQQTKWSDLDYLLVDMPPGTGDIQLTLSQQVPVSGAVIVTTPQDIALLDARKGLQMFRKVSVPVLGVVENMSTHVCTNCGHEEPLFGSGGGEQMAAEYEVELLGALPLDLRIREQTDSGNPSVIAEPEEAPADAYRATARRMAAGLAMQGKDYSRRFPNIVVENK
jgi:ATP-binding protein involved in chromosome partitioning